MAAYAATVTVDTPRANRIGNTPIGIISGSCNLTNYNSTLAALTAITGKFSGGLRVCADGISSNGYVIKWDTSGSAFKAYRAAGQTVTPSGSITMAAPTITTGTNADVSAVIATNGGALTQAAGASGITGVQASVITDARTFTGAAAAMAEAANDTDIGTFNFIAMGRL